MRKLLYSVVLVLLLASPGWAAPAHVQSANIDNTFATTCAVSLTGVTSGNLLILALAYNDATDVISSVTGTNTFTRVVNTYHGMNGLSVVLYYAQNAASGNETVTTTFSASKSANCALHEYSGVVTSGALDKSTSGSGTATTGTDGASTTSVTTTANGELIFSSINQTSGGAPVITAGTGYTLRQNGKIGGSTTNATEDLVQASAGAIIPTFTFGTTDTYNYTVATFLATGGGGGSGGKIRMNRNSR